MVHISAFTDKFKSVRRKQYEAWLCKVPIGCCVLDKVKNAKAIELLRGRNYLSNIEVNELRRSNPEIYEMIQTCLTKATDFVLNIDGNLSLITFAELSVNYVYADKSPITQESILNKAFVCEWYLSQLTPTRTTYNQAVKAGKCNPKQLQENIVMQWHKVMYQGNRSEAALACVEEIKDNFRVCLPDTKEQYYIVCDAVGSQINFQSGRFITGRQFGYMYDNRGWKLQNAEQSKGVVPKELFELISSKINAKDSFATMFYNFLQDSYKGSMAEGYGIVRDLAVTKLADYCLSVKYTQVYEELQVNYLIYTRNDEYYMVQGDIDAKFDDGLKKYLLSLEKKDKIVIKLNDLQQFKEIVQAVLSFKTSADVSNYFIPRISSNEYMSLKSYSGSEYMDINKYLRGEEASNNFEAYLHAVFISDIIERSMILKNIWHFRGVSLPKRIAEQIKEGYVLKSDSFVSTSRTSPVAFSFGLHYDVNTEEGIILVFKNTNRQHGIYMNTISIHKNTEYEVLFNIGYDFKFIKQLGNFSDEYGSSKVWLCELVEDSTRGIRKYAYKKDATEKLIAMIQMDGRLMRDFYISNVKDSADYGGCTVVLRRYGMDDYTIRINLEDGEFHVCFQGVIRDEVVFKIKEKGYQFLFQYIYHVLSENIRVKPYISSSMIATFSERFFFDLNNLFIGNNFIICSQNVNKEWRNQDKEVVSSFSLLDSDLEPIDIEVIISQEGNEYIKLILAIDGRKRIFKKELLKRFDLFEEVYWAIVCKFNLDCTRRLKRVFSILGGYHECEIEFYKQDGGVYKCYMDDKIFQITISGTNIIVCVNDSSVTLNYYEDIYNAASMIQTIM